MCCGLKEVKVPLFKNSIRGTNSSLDVIYNVSIFGQKMEIVRPSMVIMDK